MKSLESITFEDGSEPLYISSGAFMSNDLRSVVIPDRIWGISDEAFAYNQNLTDVTLGRKLRSLDEDAFFGTGLTEIRFNGVIHSIGDNALGYYRYGDDILPVDSFDIYGPAGSVAETYAQENGFTFHPITVYEGYTGDMEWYYDRETYTLNVEGGFEMDDYASYEDTPWHEWRIDAVTHQNNAHSIGANAHCGVKEITIPCLITSIGEKAIGFNADGSPIEGCVIYGYRHTAAQEYADQYDHITFVDLDYDPENPSGGSEGGDGNIRGADVGWIQRKLARIDTPYAIGLPM